MPVHNHLDTIAQLKQQTKEVKAMSVMEPEVEEEIQVEEGEFDLDAELERLGAQIRPEEPSAEETQAPLSQEELLRERVLELLRARKDAPSPEQINSWKEKYGKEAVQVIALDSDNVYIYTHLSASQWEKLQKLSTQSQANPDVEKAMREAVIKSAVLWPKLNSEFFQNCRAGLPDTLMGQIVLASYFLSPSQALSLTVAL